MMPTDACLNNPIPVLANRIYARQFHNLPLDQVLFGIWCDDGDLAVIEWIMQSVGNLAPSLKDRFRIVLLGSLSQSTRSRLIDFEQAHGLSQRVIWLFDLKPELRTAALHSVDALVVHRSSVHQDILNTRKYGPLVIIDSGNSHSDTYRKASNSDTSLTAHLQQLIEWPMLLHQARQHAIRMHKVIQSEPTLPADSPTPVTLLNHSKRATPRQQLQGPRIWAHISHVLTCHSGQFTGISRMVTAFIEQSQHHQSLDIRFCSLNPGQSEQWYEVPADLALQHVQSGFAQPIRDLRTRSGVHPAQFQDGDILLAPEVNYSGQALRALESVCKNHDIRYVPIICDTIAARYPHYFGSYSQHEFWNWLKTSIELSSMILAISQHTEQDLRWFSEQNDLPLPHMETFRLGDADLSLMPAERWKAPPGLQPQDRFVVLCCTIEPRKNHRLAYDVWRRLLLEYPAAMVPKLLCVGRMGWQSNDLVAAMRSDPLTHDHIHLLHQVTDQHLAWLYQHALFSIYPSHYEGWGIPVGEALACGKYVIASRSSSIPEVGGSFVDYHDPCDTQACYQLVQRAIFDDLYRKEREDLIRKQYQRTTWQECVTNMLDQLVRYCAPPARQEHATGSAAA